jgi:hypothetical protein
MKIRKVWLVGLMVGIFIGCLIVSTTHAQDMAIWTGKWFKSTTKYSGYNINESGVVSPYQATEGGDYAKILNVDETNKVVNLLGYSYENDEWHGESGEWRYTGGNSLDFLIYYSVCEGEKEAPQKIVYCFGFTGRIQGKMKGGILTSATIKSLGGFEWRAGAGVAGVTVTGSLIPESKLPPGIPK